MWHNAYDAYLESRVLSAGPIELVRMLYQAAIGSVRDARTCLAAGDIAARSRSINKACDTVIELASSLDHQRGGEISVRLASLYDYILRKLIEANFRQSDGPLAEALDLLTVLSSAWDGVKEQEGGKVTKKAKPVDAASPWDQAPAEYASTAPQAWSF